MTAMSRKTLLALAGLGLLLQLAVLPRAGSTDMSDWETWASWTLSRGLFHIYGSLDEVVKGSPNIDGGTTPARPTYPPLTMIVLAGAAHAYRIVSPGFVVGPRLVVFIKTPLLLARVGVTFLIWFIVRRRGGSEATAGRAALWYWLNPALILNGPWLGYLDPLFEVAGVASVAAATVRRPAIAGACLACAMLFKPQGVFFAIPLALMLRSDRAAFRRAALSAAAVGIAIVAPFLILGSPAAMVVAIGAGSLLQDLLCGQALNLWWIVSAVGKAHASAMAWLVVDPDIVRISTFRDLIGWDPRVATGLAIAAALLYAWRRARNCRDAAAPFALGAICAHIVFSIGTNAHENHLAPAVVLALLAAALQPRYWRVTAGLSVMLFINMFVFEGIGQDGPVMAFQRASVLLAIAGVGVFVWHCREFIALTRN